MKIAAALLLSVAVTACASAPLAQAPPAAAPQLLNARAELKAPRTLAVSSQDFVDGGAIPLANSGYGASISPSLSIAGAPRGTRSFAILVEDADAQREGAPILHWVVYDIPASVTALPAGIPGGAELTAPAVLRQGSNVAGQPAYRGPHPPAASKGPHHYHVEVFALDRMLPAEAGADRTALAAAMAGHVLAQGEIVGTFAAPAPAPAS